MNPSIAIAISTRNRPEAFLKCIDSIINYSPMVKIFTVDDASDFNYFPHSFTFRKRSGISDVKNKCLELCYNSVADHIFLFDDDTSVLCEDWWRPYVESELHHAMYNFGPGIKLTDKLKRHYNPNGCMLYFDRHCIDKVGGFDTKYPNKYEHTDLSRRIFNAGLTPAPFMDVIGSHNLIYCLDQDHKIERSMSKKEINDSLKAGYDYFYDQRNSKRFIEFRT